ncbi:MAG: glycosyltransferase family 2 protein [Candidatus Wildermuthbacteria bacterium]|nr:glycosyltransferase family 2 protein [Candidatus Wildermuthbacteria bacterium]
MLQDYYLNVSRASDLKDPKERFLYRFFEMLPGLLSFGSLGAVVLFSWLLPMQVAFFVFAFIVYWLCRTVYFSFHLRAGYKKMREHEKTDWMLKLQNIPNWRDMWHLVVVVAYKEPYEIIRESLRAVASSDYPKEKLIVVLALEERAAPSKGMGDALAEEFKDSFFKFLITLHPSGLPGEIAGKGSNEAWATKEAKEKIIDPLAIPYTKVIATSLDADTIVLPRYFGCLAWHYATVPNAQRASFQPIPLFINNAWQAGALSRIFSFSATFWQTMNQERPEKLITFSSHSMSFQALVDVGFKQKNIVADDSHIFWQCFLHYNGDYRAYPLYYPIRMDANVGRNFLETMRNMYRQQRRWAYGVSEVPYFLFGFLKNKKIPLLSKLSFAFEFIEGHWSWATAPILIFLSGWLPLFLGGQAFSETLVSYNLPIFTSRLLTLAMLGLVLSAFLSIQILSPIRPEYGKWRLAATAFQWALFPFTMVFFTAFPALDAQLRLLLGKYMGFWTTPKFRR